MNNINRNRPNTLVPDSILSHDIVLCCGEDLDELLDVTREIEIGNPQTTHSYRCYRFWKYSDFTLIWTGIGTGCMEPLLCEILDAGNIKRIILIGTAGLLSDESEIMGKACIIHQALPGASALRLRENLLPLEPSFPLSNEIQNKKRSVVSTDFYYGFSMFPHPAVEKIKLSNPQLQDDFKNIWKTTDLIDMETAPFYFFCKTLGGENLQYIAIRGAANTSQDFTQQTTYSKDVLRQCLTLTFRLFTT